jgi:hypothetical protein
VLEALNRFDIPQNWNGHKRTDHLPFDFYYLNHQLLKDSTE